MGTQLSHGSTGLVQASCTTADTQGDAPQLLIRKGNAPQLLMHKGNAPQLLIHKGNAPHLRRSSNYTKRLHQCQGMCNLTSSLTQTWKAPSSHISCRYLWLRRLHQSCCPVGHDMQVQHRGDDKNACVCADNVLHDSNAGLHGFMKHEQLPPSTLDCNYPAGRPRCCVQAITARFAELRSVKGDNRSVLRW